MQVHHVAVGVVIPTMIERIGTAANVGDHDRGIGHRGAIVRADVVATWTILSAPAAVAGGIAGELRTMMIGRIAESGVLGAAVVPLVVEAVVAAPAKGAAKRRAKSANCECCEFLYDVSWNARV
jgi:hypothetical protein